MLIINTFKKINITSMREFQSHLALWSVFLGTISLSPNSLYADLEPKILTETTSEGDLSLKADHFFDAQLYDRALPLYQQLVQQQTQNDLILKKLALSQYFTGDYAAVIKLAQANPSQVNLRYFAALAYKKFGQYDKAIAELTLYLNSPAPEFAAEAKYELGSAYFLNKDLANAKRIFEEILKATPSFSNPLSHIYLVRIFLLNEDYDRAEHELDVLRPFIASSDLVHYEIAFLQGEISFHKGAYADGIAFYNKALSQENPQALPWYDDILYHLGTSYVKLGEEANTINEKQKAFEQAETTLSLLFKRQPVAQNLLTLGQCYLIKSRVLNDEEAYHKGEALFLEHDILLSKQMREQALLLQAQTAPRFEMRDTLYRHLTQPNNQDSPFYAKGWYFRALNEFEENLFEKSSLSFQKAFEVLYPQELTLAASALRYAAEAKLAQDAEKNHLEALEILQRFQKHPELMAAVPDSDEIYYLRALVLLKLANETDPDYYTAAKASLYAGIQQLPEGKFADKQRYLLGTIYFKEGEYSKAREILIELADHFPQSPLAGDALFWAARSAEKQGDLAESRKLLTSVFEKYPENAYSPEAYFTLFTYKDYLQGDRTALKHLESLKDKYPDSIYAVYAHYLLGMDSKRDRRTSSGKWLTKKNLNGAIDHFHSSETTFDNLATNGKIPNKDLSQLILVRYRAVLERALTNMEIAQDSPPAKKQIYLKYAQEVLQQIIQDCSNNTHPLKESITLATKKAHIENESLYWLAVAYIHNNDDEVANQTLDEMLTKCRSATITKGYFLSRAWYEKALIAARKLNTDDALAFLQNADDAAKGNVLSTDEKLDLWIQQSLCFQQKHDFDNAILILSKAINDDSISSLRVKAMLLRANAYELQGRKELARKQLETTAKQGGEWALKAKEKLEKTYGYE